MMSADFPFSLTAHARHVASERGILLEWVERVVTCPQRTEADPNDSTLTHALGRISEYGDRVLRVVYNEAVEPRRIVTVYFDRTQKDKL
jgi:hypothetical protein